MKNVRSYLVAQCLFVAVLCCGGNKNANKVYIEPTPVAIELDRSELEEELETQVLENYQQLSLGNVSSYWDSVAENKKISLAGVHPVDLVFGMKESVKTLDRRLYRNRSPVMLSKNLDRHLTKDQSIGWTYDEVSYRLYVGNKRAAVPIRQTLVLARDVDRWVIVSEHQSYAMNIREAQNLAFTKDLLEAKRFKTAIHVSKNDSKDVLALVSKAHNGGLALEDISNSPEAKTLVLWPGPLNEFWGEEILSAPGLAEQLDQDVTIKIKDVYLNQSKSKNQVWGIINLVAIASKGANSYQLGLRGSYFFERKGQGAKWKLMQAHIAIPVEEHLLSKILFGDIK